MEGRRGVARERAVSIPCVKAEIAQIATPRKLEERIPKLARLLPLLLTE